MGHSRRGQAGMMEWKKLHEMHGVSVPQQRANGQRMRWMQPRRAQNMRNMRPMQRMGPRQGMGQNPMLETLQEMRSEMQAMHQELVKLRKEVRSLKGEQAKSAKNKKQAAQKKKAAQKKQKAQKAKKAAMLEVAPHIISKKVLISKDGGTTSEVHILEEGDTGTWIELKQD
jgi:septal ring factor EnvC (AmiA/AmiB activator)